MLLKQSGYQTLLNQRLEKILTTVYKVVNRQCVSESLCDLAELRKSNYSLRGDKILTLPKVNTTKYSILWLSLWSSWLAKCLVTLINLLTYLLTCFISRQRWPHAWVTKVQCRNISVVSPIHKLVPLHTEKWLSTCQLVDKALTATDWYRFLLLQVYEFIKLTLNILFVCVRVNRTRLISAGFLCP